MEKVIEAKGIKKYYKRGHETVKALDGIDIEVYPSEILSIVGPSGSGKTTLMNLLGCLDVPTEGELKIAGVDVNGFSEAQLTDFRRKNIGFIFQQFYIIPTLNVEENVLLPRVFIKRAHKGKEVSQLLERLGLKGKEKVMANMLNGGDMQRVAIARALVNLPKILIADEPTGRLETKVRDSILELFRELAKSGIAIIIATHDLELAEQTERIIYLQDGKIVTREESSLYK